jgi:hypothetical protein
LWLTLSNGSESGEVSSLAFNNEKMLVSVLTADFMSSSSFNHAIKLWNITAGTLQAILHGHTSYLLGVAFIKGDLLASSSFDEIKTWNTTTRREIRTLQHSRSMQTLSCVAFNKNGLLASGSRSGNISLWNATTKNLIKSWNGDSTVSSLAFNNESSVLASADSFGVIKLWSVNIVGLLRTVVAHRSAVTSLAFNKNNMLASGSWDEEIKLWDTNTGDLLRTMKGSQGY